MKQDSVSLVDGIGDGTAISLRESDGVPLRLTSGLTIYSRAVSPGRMVLWREVSPGVVVGIQAVLLTTTGQFEQRRQLLLKQFLRVFDTDATIVGTPMKATVCDVEGISTSNRFYCRRSGDSEQLTWQPIPATLPDACSLFRARRIAAAVQAPVRVTRGFEETYRRTCVLTDPITAL
jgi:hypothetical protein